MDWQVGDEARVIGNQNGGPAAGTLVSISGSPYAVDAGADWVEVSYGECVDGFVSQWAEVPCDDLEPLCAACMLPALTGARVQTDFLCATCAEYEENLLRERIAS